MTQARGAAPAQTSGWAVVAPGSKALQRCSRCVYDEETPAITFDAEGHCNYCALHDRLDREHPTGPEGGRRLQEMVREIKNRSRKSKFDVVIGVSGGCDSSYLLYLAVKLGLRPLAVHFDNTWDSTVAVENIHNVLKKLGIELYTYVVDNEEYDDIYRSFLQAGVVEVDAATDIAIAAVCYMAAEQNGIGHIFDGHSFRTEGVSPLGWSYFDGKYVESVQRRFGTRPLETFPNLWMGRFLKWTLLSGIRRYRPMYYVDYQKEEAKKFLSRELGWKWYGGHHLENRFSAWSHSFYLPRRFGVDQRKNGFSALVRSGQMTREDALRSLDEPPYGDPEIVEYLKKRLGLTDQHYDDLLTQPRRTFRDFETYKPWFERMRPLFWVLSRMDLVPKSFYVKYCSTRDV